MAHIIAALGRTQPTVDLSASLSHHFTVAHTRSGCSVFALPSTAAVPAAVTTSAAGAAYGCDSDTESVQEIVDSHQSNTMAEEIMLSQFVMSMFALPDSDDEAVSTPYAPTPSPPRALSELDPISILEGIVDGRVGLT